MSSVVPTGEVRVGLAYVGLSRSVVNVLEHLAFARIRATFFVPPHQLVSEAVRWRHVIEEGHELGNSTFLGVTDEGRLPNWDFQAIAGDLLDTNRLLQELGMKAVESVYLPGRFHTCADGSYRKLVQRQFSVCVSDSEKANSVNGRIGQLTVQSPGARTRLTAPSIIVVRGDLDLGAHSRMLLRLAKYETGPLRLLCETL